MLSYTAWRTPVALLALAAWGTPLSIHTAHPHAVQRAEFVLGELQGLSDTGIFRTLSLTRISAAATQDGVFHFNTLLALDLASPYFASGQQEERFEVVVMENKEDGHVSFSIDSFPNMDPEAMAFFYIQQVEQHRQRRAEFFSKIDEQSAGDARAVLNMGTSDPAKLAVAMLDYDAKQLLALLGEGAREDPIRQAVGAEIVRRLEQPTI